MHRLIALLVGLIAAEPALAACPAVATDCPSGTANNWIVGGALTAGSVLGTGFATYLASPPAIGGTTPAAGSFTTLSASSTVSGTGFSAYLASPPAIGGTAAAAGSFTTLSASGTVSGSGFSAYLASPPAIGGSAAAAGSFTTLAASSTVSGAGFSTYLASPPAIGGTAAAAGSFTTLSASSTVSGSGFSTYLASPPAIGGSTPSAGSFTTLSATNTTTLNTTAGGWSTFNYGKQLYVEAGSGGSTNPAIAISDLHNTNLIGLANNAGVAQLFSGPAYTDGATSPTLLVTAGTSGVGILGTNTNNNASTGFVGELLTHSTTATSLSTGVVANADQISLTAGDWDCTGVASFHPAGTTTTTQIDGGFSTTTATLPAEGQYTNINMATITAGQPGIPVPTQRFSLASTTTVFLAVQAVFGTSTMTVNGYSRCRRVR